MGRGLGDVDEAADACDAAVAAFTEDPDVDVAVTVGLGQTEAATMKSKSKNTPFDGWTLRGGVAGTVVGGRAVYVNDVSGLRL
mgnify:CR=1 FL=1